MSMFSKVFLCREDEHMSTPGEEGEETDRKEGELGGVAQEEEEVPRINVEIPRCVANLGSEVHFVKLPNFLSVETRCGILSISN